MSVSQFVLHLHTMVGKILKEEGNSKTLNDKYYKY